MFPLKAGDQLFTDLPDAKPNEHLKFRFDVAIVSLRKSCDVAAGVYGGC